VVSAIIGAIRADADIGVGLPHSPYSIGGRRGDLGDEVVTGGAALAHHLERADLGRQILELDGAPARRPGIGVQQKLERPAIRRRLGKRDRRVGVGVDQSGDQQPAGGIDALGVARDTFTRRQYGGNGIAIDQEVGASAVEAARGQQAAAVNELLQARISREMTAFSIRKNEATPPSMRKP
jgi:hypothetical protein